MKLVYLALVTGLLALAADGQSPTTTPDLTGTWEYVAADSPFKDRVLVITHTGDEMSLVENYVFENLHYTHRSTLYTDGRGEVNRKQFPDGEPPSESTVFTTPVSSAMICCVRSAINAALSDGRARASSNESV